MSKSSIRYVDTTYIYGQKTVRTSVTNPVIYGHFPKKLNKKSSVEKINKILSLVLLSLVMVSLVSYYFVSDGERNMNNIGRKIIALTNENIELQNKLDTLHSFNKVDAIMQGKTTLDTAKKVIEIPAVNVVSMPKIQSQPINYHWSIGY